MGKRNMKRAYWFRVMTLLIGGTMLALSGLLLVNAHLGSDSITVFNQGIAELLNIDFSYGVIIGNAVFLIVLLIVDRKSIGVGTLLIMVSIGLMTVLFTKIGFIPDIADCLWKQIIMVVIGAFFGTFGIAIYVKSDIGLSPFEGVQIFVQKKLNTRFAYVKIANDAILFTIGYFMGGQFGIFSIITVIIYGPLADMFMMLIDKSKLFEKKEYEKK